MEICRAFELFEFIMAIIFAITLIACVIILVIAVPKRIKEGGYKSAKYWITALFYLAGGGIIGTIIAYTYEYIKSMFC